MTRGREYGVLNRGVKGREAVGEGEAGEPLQTRLSEHRGVG